MKKKPKTQHMITIPTTELPNNRPDSEMVIKVHPLNFFSFSFLIILIILFIIFKNLFSNICVYNNIGYLKGAMMTESEEYKEDLIKIAKKLELSIQSYPKDANGELTESYLEYLSLMYEPKIAQLAIQQSGVSASIVTEGSNFTIWHKRSGASCAQPGDV